MPNSAYNFVPLSDKVFFPDWSDKVSMDIPFRDGISGEITIELTSHTPIFTKNSDSPEDTSFFKIMPDGNTYGIPGTSIKGVIRNVLEIASFGKIKTDDKRYAIRDLHNSMYTSRISKNNIKAGWLSQDNFGNYYITPCSFIEIEQETIEEFSHKKYQDENIRLGWDSGETSKIKYEKFQNQPDVLSNRFNINGAKAVYSSNGTGEIGTLVFTGQPTGRFKKDKNNNYKFDDNGQKILQTGAKHIEFVFYKTQDNPIRISNELYSDFCFIHSDPQDPKKANEEWTYWKGRMQNHNEPVPVFYLKSKENNSIEAMGLAMMFRLPYNYSILDTLRKNFPEHTKTTTLDLAETIFGYIDESNNQNALRGRVTFSRMIANNNRVQAENARTTILSSPKPTFYPYYITQEQDTSSRIERKVKEYKTFMDSDCIIAGWKRYPIRNHTNEQQPSEENEQINKTFSPLPPETTFTGKIHLHNLKKCELGAILWALDFGKRNECRHSVGMAKPYGFGSATIRIIASELITNLEYRTHINNEQLLEECRLAFLEEMEKFHKGGWEQSCQIRNLIDYAQIHNNNTLTYPKLSKSQNDFAELKKDKYYLEPEITPQECQNIIQRLQHEYRLEKEKREEAAKQAKRANKTSEFLAVMDAKEKFINSYKNKKNSKYTRNDSNFTNYIYSPIILNCIKKESEKGSEPIALKEFDTMTPEDSFTVTSYIPQNEFVEFLEELIGFINDKTDPKSKNLKKIKTKISNN